MVLNVIGRSVATVLVAMSLFGLGGCKEAAQLANERQANQHQFELTKQERAQQHAQAMAKLAADKELKEQAERNALLKIIVPIVVIGFAFVGYHYMNKAAVAAQEDRKSQDHKVQVQYDAQVKEVQSRHQTCLAILDRLEPHERVAMLEKLTAPGGALAALGYNGPGGPAPA